MYTESSSPAKTGDKASLTSRIFQTVHNRCMTFFYSMNGPGIGALRVFLVNAETGHELLKLFYRFFDNSPSPSMMQCDM